MAKLIAHGTIVGTIDLMFNKIRYMSDGQILRNTGDGWKFYRQCKPGITPQVAYQHRLEKIQKYDQGHPHQLALRKALHKATSSIRGRFYLYTAVEYMPSDPDGVWSEMHDSYTPGTPKISLDTAVELCRLYALAEQEAKDGSDE